MMFQVLIIDQNALPKLRPYNIAKVIHHMQRTPNTMQKNQNKKCFYWIFMIFLNKISNESVSKKIVLDPGIGFGKNLKHNLTLISKNIFVS